MADATSYDGTAIIIIDSTTSDSENFTAAVAYGLTSDFDSIMGPLGIKCNSIGGQMDQIKDQISGIGNNHTPGGVMDNAVANGLNGAYNSSKWAQGKDAINMAKKVLDDCDFFKANSDKFPKYGDPLKQIKSLASAVVSTAFDAVEGALDLIKESSGYQLIEAGIGKSIAAITNTGRAVYDVVEGAVTDVASAISPLIEYGKAAVSQTATLLSGATKELAGMDSLIDCLTAIGGPDFAPQIDEMMDQMNCYYDRLGVFDDPLLPNFGEFDVDNYLSGIGTLNPQAATNIKKAINMYSKAENNAQGSIAKAVDIGKSAKSATDPSATTNSIAQKKDSIATKTVATQVIPAIPGKSEEKTVELPPPEPVGPYVPPDPPVPAEEKVPVSMFIKETKFDFGTASAEADYDKYDPGHKSFNQYLSDTHSLFASLKIYEPDNAPDFVVTTELTKITPAGEFKTDDKGTKWGLFKAKCVVYTTIFNKTTELGVRTVSSEYVSNDQWTDDKDQYNSDEYRATVVIKDIRHNISRNTYTEADINGIL